MSAEQPRPTTAADADAEAPSFEQAMAQLEAIIDRVETGEAGLEQSIRDCEAGAKLIARCRKVLDASEKKIAELNFDELAGAAPADTFADTEPDAAWGADEADDGEPA